MPISDVFLKPGLYLSFVMSWKHKLYLSMFVDSNGVQIGDIVSVNNCVNCSWNSSTDEITTDPIATNGSFRINSSGVDITFVNQYSLYNSISVSLLKSTLGIPNNDYAAIFTSSNIHGWSQKKSDKVVPHSASEFRGYCHSADYRINQNLTSSSSVYWGSAYQFTTEVFRQEATSENYPYKVEFVRGGSVISSHTGDMAGVYNKSITSNSVTNWSAGATEVISCSARLYYQIEDLSWVEDTSKRQSFDFTIYGVPVIGAYTENTRFSRTIRLNLYPNNQTDSPMVIYPHLSVNIGGTVYESTNSNSLGIGTGANAYTYDFTFLPIVGTGTIVECWVTWNGYSFTLPYAD